MSVCVTVCVVCECMLRYSMHVCYVHKREGKES